jgi:NADPH:quinone reductase-like Zn-dependent oxidoreductase
LKAIVLQEFGGPESLLLTEVPTPSVGPGQVLIAVEAAGVGFADILVRQGMYAAQSGFVAGAILGGDVAGTVIEVGEGVDRAWLDARVHALVFSGGHAEYAVADLANVTPVPEVISAAEAVALGVNGFVAIIGLERGHLQAGERVLVRGAAGGIGVLAVQLAALAGATVAATTSSTERGQRLLELGASEILDRAGDGEGTEGFDVIIDPIAGPDLVSFLDKLNKNGRIVVVGVVGGPTPSDLGQQLFARFRNNPTLSFFSGTGTDVVRIKDIFDLAAAGKLKPVVDITLPLEEVSEAHARIESSASFGKVILEIRR